MPSGDVLGPFQLLEPAARGAFSEVWRARHRDTGRLAAVKVLEASADAGLVREAAAWGRMQHPNVMPLLDLGVTSGRMWFASPWLDGGTIAERAPNTWQELSDVVQALLAALSHAHAHGILHRDVKPANVLYDTVRASWVLTDFGIAHSMHGHRTGPQAAGTAWYMPPEQIRGEQDLQRPWSDLYALAAVVWHVTTGAPPFAGSLDEVLNGHLHAPLPAFIPRFQVPDALEAWVHVLMSKEPERRAAYAADAADAFADLVLGSESEPDVDVEITLDFTQDGPLPTLEGPFPPARFAPMPRTAPLPHLPEASGAVLAMAYLHPPADRIEPLWYALQQVRQDGESWVMALDDEDLAYLACRSLGIQVSETGQAYIVHIPEGSDLSQVFRHLLGATDDPGRLPERIRGWAQCSDADADRFARGVETGDGPVLAQLVGRVARSRAVVVLAASPSPQHETFLAALETLHAPVLAVHGGAAPGTPLALPPLVMDDLLGPMPPVLRSIVGMASPPPPSARALDVYLRKHAEDHLRSLAPNDGESTPSRPGS